MLEYVEYGIFHRRAVLFFLVTLSQFTLSICLYHSRHFTFLNGHLVFHLLQFQNNIKHKNKIFRLCFDWARCAIKMKMYKQNWKFEYNTSHWNLFRHFDASPFKGLSHEIWDPLWLTPPYSRWWTYGKGFTYVVLSRDAWCIIIGGEYVHRFLVR